MATSRHHVVSVVLGSDATEYESSSFAMNKHVGKHLASSASRASENINKECHVQFGEPGSKRKFSTSNKLVYPAGGVQKYRGELATEVKDMLMRTSSCHGNDIVSYESSMHAATQWDKKAVAESISLRNEIRARTGSQPTRGMSYDDEIEYVSEAHSAFENKFQNYKPSVMAANVKNDLRATHFALGYEKPDYKTSSHISSLSSDQFLDYSPRSSPPLDLKRSTVEIL